jgi:SAM-dependent methyltransferase
MPISYESVVPWGRSFDEYTRMFALRQNDFQRSILGCGDGPAAFNAGMRTRGYRATSVDPLYRFSRREIEQRIRETYEIVISQTRNNSHLFRWVSPIDSVDALGAARVAAMHEFLQDYDAGRIEGRYVEGELPSLPFSDGQFDLVLCSHFLFLYTDNLTRAFHLRGIDEMLRVGREVRVFPIVDANARTSVHLAPVMVHFAQTYKVDLVTVDYEFQIGGHSMLRIAKAAP